MADVGLPPDHPPQTNRISCGIRGRAIGLGTKRSFAKELHFSLDRTLFNSLDRHPNPVHRDISMFR